MYISQLFEANESRLVVIYPGRFQPFHQGHAAVFAELQGKFGRENVYIGTNPNPKQDEKNPFNITDKIALMHAAGVPDDRIAKVTDVYKWESYQPLLNFDPNNTVVIFAVGEPDAKRLEVDALYTEFTPTGKLSKIPDGKKVGDPKPFRSFKNFNETLPANQASYVFIVPEVKKSIEINGEVKDVSHGTECRNLWLEIKDDPAARKSFLEQLYGRATPELEHIFDKIQGGAAPTANPQRVTKLPRPLEPAGGLDKVAKSAQKANKLIKEAQLLEAVDLELAALRKELAELKQQYGV